MKTAEKLSKYLSLIFLFETMSAWNMIASTALHARNWQSWGNLSAMFYAMIKLITKFFWFIDVKANSA